MKKITALLSAIAMVATMVTVATAAVDKGPATMTLDYSGHAKKVVKDFKHAEHQGRMPCKECHHKDDEGKTPRACKTCHQEKKGDAPAIKDAYHNRCKDCHAKGKKGPTKCDECHGK